MLQNRVDPAGSIVFAPARGAWMGNRGVLHNERKEILRAYKTKAWITCRLEFRGRHREIMRKDHWTELFFLDEATAFSAGHRPCFQCRYEDHQRFKECWVKGNPHYGFSSKTPVAEIDKVLHAERLCADHSKNTFAENVLSLPEGTCILLGKEMYLLLKGRLFSWNPGGYGEPIDFPGEKK